MVKIYIDSERQFDTYANIQKQLAEAITAQGFARIRNTSSHLMLCYLTVVLQETAKAGGQKLDNDASQKLISDFGKWAVTGDLKQDLIIVAFGMHSLAEKIRPILKKCMEKYPDEPFFPACAVEEFAGGYLEGQERTFRPGEGPDWEFVQHLCKLSIGKWPNYPRFYLYDGLAYRRKKKYAEAITAIMKYRDLVKPQGGIKLYNANQLLNQLQKQKIE